MFADDGHAIRDAFLPFQEGGATSRNEADQALMLVVAEYYQYAARHGPQALEDYRAYALASRRMSSRLHSEAGDDALDEGVLAVGMFQRFLDLIHRLDPNAPDYWRHVGAELGLPSVGVDD